MSGGLLRLPDDILRPIICDLIDSFQLIFSLSRVCRHFCSIILNEPKIWSKFSLEASWDPRLIHVVAGRSGDRPLRANASCWLWDDIPPSLKAILDLQTSLEELCLFEITIPLLKKIQYYLKDKPMRVMHTLCLTSKMTIDDQDDIIPFARVARQCPLPALRTLKTNVVPHPSMGRGLTRFSMVLDAVVKLRHILGFLAAAAESLREFEIDPRTVSFQDEMHEAPLITLPNLDLFHLHCWTTDAGLFFNIFREKVIPWHFRRLTLSIGHRCKDRVLPEFLFPIRNVQSVRELTLEYDNQGWRERMFSLDLATVHISPYVEVLFISGLRLVTSAHSREIKTSQTYSIRRLCFENCKLSDAGPVLFVRDLSLRIRQDIRLEFIGCEGWKDGSFPLEAIDSILPNSPIASALQY